MPRTTYETQSIQQYVDRINGREGMAPHEKISIKLSTIFNRGDEENGVWPIKMKRSYIDSVLNGMPCGQISLVRDYGNARNQFAAPSLILDGANKSRTLRDFVIDKFSIPYTFGEDDQRFVLFSELPERVKALFLASSISISKTELMRDDPADTIANMFTRLNTQQISLSHGELIKAYSWRKNHQIPEIAKHLIGGPWQTHITHGLTEGEPYERDPVIAQNLDLINTVKIRWADSPLGELGERNRLENLAFVCGMIIASVQQDIGYYDKRFSKLQSHLDDVLTFNQVRKALEDILKFIDIMNVCYHDTVLGKRNKGMPSRTFTIHIYNIIVDPTKTAQELSRDIIKYKFYFRSIRHDFEGLKRFKFLCSGGGNNEVGENKFNLVRQEIENYVEEHVNSDEEN